MHSRKQAELIDTILKVFPGSSIVSKSELEPIRQIEKLTKHNSELAKRVKPRSPVLRAGKRKGIDSRQLSLFDNAGGVK